MSGEQILYNRPTFPAQLDMAHPLTRGLVGCWLLNDPSGLRAFDSSPYGNHGTGVSGVAGRWQARTFNGSTERISLPLSTSLEFASADGMTLEFWAKFEDFANYRILAGNGDGLANNDSYHFRTEITTGTLFGRVGSGAANETITGGTNVGTSSFRQCIFGYDKAFYYLFLDGQQDATPVAKAITARLLLTNNYIGWWLGAGELWMKGDIALVRYWNRWLSDSERKEIFTNPYRMFLSTSDCGGENLLGWTRSMELGSSGEANDIIATDTCVFVSISSSPARVYKLRKSDLSILGNWTGETGQNSAYNLTYHDGYVYVSLGTSPGQVVKINTETMKVEGNWVGTSGQNIAKGIVCDTNSIYVASQYSADPGQVIKINKTTMLTQTIWTGAVGEGWVQNIDSDGTNIYAGLDLVPFKVKKIRMSDMVEVGSWDAEAGQTLGGSSVYKDGYLYCPTYNATGKAYKIDISDMTTFATGDSSASLGKFIGSAASATKLYLGAHYRGRIVVFNTSTMALSDAIQSIYGSAHGVLVDGEDLYVTGDRYLLRRPI